MLNILLLKSRKRISKIANLYQGEFKAENRYFPPTNKEWYNSIYTFNKNTLKSLPTADNIVTYLIKAYFNMFSVFLNKKNNIRTTRFWLRKLSTRKFWIAKPEIKHTNDTINIDLYVYNRNKVFYLYKLNKFMEKIFFYKISKFIGKGLSLNKFIGKDLSLKFKINKLRSKGLSLKYMENKYIKSLTKFILRKELHIMHLIQSNFFSRFKFNSTYISPLIYVLNKIYKKKIIFNIVRVKNFMLNGDIFTQIILYKTINRKKHRNISRVLKKSFSVFKPFVVKRSLTKREGKSFKGVQNASLVNVNKADITKDILESMLSSDDFYNKENYINTVKNKVVRGIRIKASGRLSKRITASRSVVKIRTKGALKHVDSGYKGKSSLILKGNLKSNTQFTKLNSKIRIGSFGLKGWVSSV